MPELKTVFGVAMVPESIVTAAIDVNGVVVTTTEPLVVIVIELGLPELAQAVSTGTEIWLLMLFQVGAGLGQLAKAGPDINAAVAAVSINARLCKANPLLLLDRWLREPDRKTLRQVAETPQSGRERRHLSQYRPVDASRKLPFCLNFSLFNQLLARHRHDER